MQSTHSAAAAAWALVGAGEDAGEELRQEANDVLEWLELRRQQARFRVDQVALKDIEGWRLDESGNLSREDGAFFSIEGLDIVRHESAPRHWAQPVIYQSEIGLLGLLIRRQGDVFQGLFQAKAEPGQANVVQLAPTVQATRSNFMRAHGGSATRYLDRFWPPVAGVRVDALQSEQGSRFLRKHNRNMVVEVEQPVPVADGFRWISLGAIWLLLGHDDVINMDTRSVLSCLPVAPDMTEAHPLPNAEWAGRPTVRSFLDPVGSAHSTTDILSWLAHERQRYCVRTRLRPLRGIEDWRVGDDVIEHVSGGYFRVIGARVSLSGREVSEWSQPMIEAASAGMIAFLAKEINGRTHVLVRAKCEAGLTCGVELGPTVQCRLASTKLDPTEHRLLRMVLDAPPDRVLYRAVLSEEGGRFYRERNHYQIIDAGELAEAEPDGYRWMTAAQLKSLTALTGFVNVEARSLLACLTSFAATSRASV